MEAYCCSSSSALSASILAAAPDAAALRRRLTSAAAVGGGRTPAATRPLRASAVTMLATTAAPSRRRRGPGVVVRAVFERFTERSVKAVVFSEREARGMGDETVAPHHRLLGLVVEDRTLVGFLGSGLRVDLAVAADEYAIVEQVYRS